MVSAMKMRLNRLFLSTVEFILEQESWRRINLKKCMMRQRGKTKKIMERVLRKHGAYKLKL